MKGLVGELLALAIDPAVSPRMAVRRTRKIVFESPTPGKPSTWARDLMMLDFLKQQLRSNVKRIAAYKLTAERYGCSERSVRDIWKAHEEKWQSAVKEAD
jgi:hypothetical protein